MTSVQCHRSLCHRSLPWNHVEDEAAQHFGRIHHELRRVGRVMSVVDMQLAAIAFALGNCTLVTKDGDLSAVLGLQLENWETA